MRELLALGEVGDLGGRRLLPALVLQDDDRPVGVEQGVGDPGAVLAGAEGLVRAVQPVGVARCLDGQEPGAVGGDRVRDRPRRGTHSISDVVASIGAGWSGVPPAGAGDALLWADGRRTGVLVRRTAGERQAAPPRSTVAMRRDCRVKYPTLTRER